MYDIIFIGLIVFGLLSVILYHVVRYNNAFKPSEVIIGKRAYVHHETRLYVDVVDFDGTTVFFHLNFESEIAENVNLPKNEFLKIYRKVVKPSSINSDYMTD